MNKTNLKKEIERIGKLTEAGETIRLTLTENAKQAHLKVGKNRATQIPGKTMVAVTDSGSSGQSLFLDLGAPALSDEQIVDKVEKASDHVPALAAAEGDVPSVILTRDDQRGLWILHQSCSYQTAGGKVTALAGFETDLASIPRIFWSIIDPPELSLAAPLFHDLIYRRGGRLLARELDPGGHVFKRAATDLLFLEIMTKAGIPKWKCDAAYWAVRGFAGFAWSS